MLADPADPADLLILVLLASVCIGVLGCFFYRITNGPRR